MSNTVERAGVIPATLSFLSIYNPSLSTSDETFEDQIVYYYSRPDVDRSILRQRKDGGDGEETKDEKDEKLRQIGLAQGMTSFAKNFSNGKAVDWIETEKSRIILHELEQDWWLLASIDLTRLPSSPEPSAHDHGQRSEIPIEYSAREVCPPALLLQQVLRAHQIFLLHQASSIAELFVRVARPKFCGYLKRFWDGFIWNWDVLLNGNPAVDIFNGLKLAVGGELGIGVGEEEWGSGEREVLEGFIDRTEGLVDMVVSRFGDAPDSTREQSTKSPPGPLTQNTNSFRQMSGEAPRPSDGIVFSGIGALTRRSVRDISSWMEWLHRHEQDAYGVRDNPTSAPRRKRRKVHVSASSHREMKFDNRQRSTQVSSSPIGDSREAFNGSPQGPNIPPSIVANNRTHVSAEESSTKPTGALTVGKKAGIDPKNDDPSSGTETLMKYLTLGVYGSTWGIPSGRPPLHNRVSSLGGTDLGADSKSTAVPDKSKIGLGADTPKGYFLIGLQGELEETVGTDTTDSELELGTDAENAADGNDSNNRVVMRMLHVERLKGLSSGSDIMSANSKNETTAIHRDRLRVVVYVQQPFIFTFLFELQTDALAIPSFYRSLHHQLGPLQRPLLASTSPSKVSERLWESVAPKSTIFTISNQPIGDLIYDPVRLTVHTTIPNIPEPGVSIPTDSTSTPSWTRIEALSVHSQILNTYTSTRRHTSELERTCKTSRGWWVVWMQLPHASLKHEADNSADAFREAFLIRKASDYVSPAARKSSGRFGRDVSGASGSGAWGPGKLAEGIGIDARQYIEGLLSLSR